MKTNTYRELQSRFETIRDAIKQCEENPDHAMAYFLPEYREQYPQAYSDLMAYVIARQAEGKTLCPFSLEWIGGNAEESAQLDREQREQEAAQERSASYANERAYGGSVD